MTSLAFPGRGPAPPGLSRRGQGREALRAACSRGHRALGGGIRRHLRGRERRLAGDRRLAIRAVAAAESVEDFLLAEWRRSLPELERRSEAAARSAAEKGWRRVGEIEEIAATFAAAGEPDGFHLAAARVFSGYPAR